MGYASAQGMIEHAGRDLALEWHVRHNHYPPLPLSLVPACQAAIKAYAEGDETAEIELPKGLTWRHQTSLEAWELVDACHLESFVEDYANKMNQEGSDANC